MPRFNEKRAEAFSVYAITALVRDARAEGMTFVKMSRAELATTLDTKKLHEHHVELVRSTVAAEGVGMADLGHEFFFFETGMKGQIFEPGQEILTHVTDEFVRLYPSEAANEMWDEGTYKAPERKPVRAAAKRATAGAVKVR